MTRQHKFGGIWTEQKLAKLKGYLEAYGRVFSGEKTSHFTTYYVDAFAGTGSRSEKNLSKASDALFPEFNDSDSAELGRGVRESPWRLILGLRSSSLSSKTEIACLS